MKLKEILNSKFDEVREWLTAHGVNATLSGTSKGVWAGSGINLSGKNLSQIPIQFFAVSTSYILSNNHFTNLKDCSFPRDVPYVDISNNPIKSLEGISELIDNMEYKGSYMMQGIFDFSGCPIESGGLGLLLLTGIREIIFKDCPHQEPFEIIKKYLRGNGTEFECQNELEEAGYGEFAKL